MGKFWLIGFLLCLGATKDEGKNYSLIRTQWVGDERMDLLFIGNTIQSQKYDFLDKFKIIGDTLFIQHDYTGKEYYTQDSSGNTIEMMGYKLSDSKFLIHKLDSIELVLLPLNLSAKKITEEVNPINNRISNYDRIKRIDTLESPRIYLKSIKGLYEKIEFDTIYFSYKVQYHHSETFYDLILYKDGQFCAAKKSHPYKLYKGNSIKKEISHCQGKLNDSTMKQLQELFYNSGIKKYKDLRSYIITASHHPRINTTIIFENQIKTYNCSEVDFNILMLPFIKKLEHLINFNDYNHKNIKQCFPTTYRKELKKLCK